MLSIEQHLPKQLGEPLSATDLIVGADIWGVENAHLLLLFEAGFIDAIKEVFSINPNNNTIKVWRLTWAGYEFLDDIRSPEIWRKTKERAGAMTSVGLGFIWEIAKAELRLP